MTGGLGNSIQWTALFLTQTLARSCEHPGKVALEPGATRTDLTRESRTWEAKQVSSRASRHRMRDHDPCALVLLCPADSANVKLQEVLTLNDDGLTWYASGVVSAIAVANLGWWQRSSPIHWVQFAWGRIAFETVGIIPVSQGDNQIA